jgi:hypothetical protein
MNHWVHSLMSSLGLEFIPASSRSEKTRTQSRPNTDALSARRHQDFVQLHCPGEDTEKPVPSNDVVWKSECNC